MVFSDTPAKTRNQLMGQAVTLEPEHFHAALHQRHGMMITLVVQRFLDFWCEGQLDGHDRHYTKHWCVTVSYQKRNLPPRGV